MSWLLIWGGFWISSIVYIMNSRPFLDLKGNRSDRIRSDWRWAVMVSHGIIRKIMKVFLLEGELVGCVDFDYIRGKLNLI